jgi:predicted DNA-binding transcriptional regulator YafY
MDVLSFDIEQRPRVNLSEHAMETILSDLLDFEGDKPAVSGAVSKIYLAYHHRAKHDPESVAHFTSLKPDTFVKQAPRLQNKAREAVRGNLDVVNNAYDGVVGRYVKSVVEQYAALPYLQRERVYFTETIRLIEAAIQDGKRVRIVTNEGVFLIRPYRVLSDRLSTYNYLACYAATLAKSEDSISVFRISRIRRVDDSGQPGGLSAQEKNSIKDAIRIRGLPFLRAGTTEVLVRLSDNGKRLYSNLIQNRPIYTSKNGDVYTFNCTEAQAQFYFFKFGADAEILKPASLRSRFKDLYRKASQEYRQ